MTREIAELLKVGAKLALRIGKRVPRWKLTSLPWEARKVACSRDFSELSFNDNVALNWSKLNPIKVSPFPKVASGCLKREFCWFCSWASNAEMAVLFAWLMPPPEMNW